jgi:hypothetical protein
MDTAETLSFRSFLDTTKIQKLIRIMESERKVSAGRIYILVITLQKSLNFIADFCFHTQFSISVADLPPWDLLKVAARTYKSSELQRNFSKKFIGPIASKTLTQVEMATLLKMCLHWLQEKGGNPTVPVTNRLRKSFLAHWITAFFVSVPPPRVQVLQKLIIDETFFYDDSVFYFKFDGHNPLLKARKPLFLIVPEHLTESLKIWIKFYRPPIKADCKKFVFPNNSGTTARRDWSALTKSITLAFIKKAIAPRNFR